MAASAEVRLQLDELMRRHGELVQKIGVAQQLKVSKEGEVSAHTAASAAATSETSRRRYAQQAVAASKVVASKGNEIAELNRRLAGVC